MSENPFETITDFYNARVRMYGIDPKACDYGRPESQQLKYEVLAGMADYTGCSVLDIGCGFADYYTYLASRYDDVKYSGIDLSDEMIAKARVQRPGLDLIAGNFLELPSDRTYDYVTANGIFYLLGSDASTLMKHILSEMFHRCHRGISFNSLSIWASFHESGEYYANPLEVVEWCRELSPWIILRHDYLPHDFSVFVSRVPMSS